MDKIIIKAESGLSIHAQVKNSLILTFLEIICLPSSLVRYNMQIALKNVIILSIIVGPFDFYRPVLLNFLS